MYFEIYQEAPGLLSLTAGQWRWTLISGNNEPIASGESYVNKVDCLRTISLIANLDPATPIKERGAPINALAAALRSPKK